MKILKHGSTSKVVTCPHCKCQFRYCGNDISSTKEATVPFNFSYKTLLIKYVHCPECDYEFEAERE